MNNKFLVRATALFLALSAVGFADEVAEQYAKLMKPAVAANGALQKGLAADLSSAATTAPEVKKTFHEIEVFWANRNAADAVTFSKNIQDAADKAMTLAASGQKDEAIAAAKTIGANCQGCHAAHREKAADGSWMVK